MGLFDKKQGSASSDDGIADDLLADEAYREELRTLGKEQFKELIASQATRLESEMNAMMTQVSDDLKAHTSRRIDALMERLDTEINNQLNDRMRSYNQVSSEAQELVAQSLSRNAQMVHEKFQQLSLDLQKTIASQEVQMATVFQDSKSQVTAIQSQQVKMLEQLRASEEMTRQEAQMLLQGMRQTIGTQSSRLNEVYEESIKNVEYTRSTQAAMIETLTRTTQALEGQYAQLQQLLTQTITEEKAMVAKVINDNMARIVEHYLIGALGEQSNIREQLPSILQHMEESQQAMMDDMKL